MCALCVWCAWCAERAGSARVVRRAPVAWVVRGRQDWQGARMRGSAGVELEMVFIPELYEYFGLTTNGGGSPQDLVFFHILLLDKTQVLV